MSAVKRGRIFVVSAPSGGGKTTILNYVREQIPDLVYSISATTRPPRLNEVNGTHYFFLSVEEFKARITRNEFAEWQTVHDNYYGTPRDFIDRTVESGRHIVMDIDVYGKKKFDQVYPDTVGILLLPPSLEILEQRLRSRATDSEAVIQTRLHNARLEMEFAHREGKYEYTVINDVLARAQEEFLGIIKRAIGT
jgi:guanylate kinase